MTSPWPLRPRTAAERVAIKRAIMAQYRAASYGSHESELKADLCVQRLPETTHQPERLFVYMAGERHVQPVYLTFDGQRADDDR